MLKFCLVLVANSCCKLKRSAISSHAEAATNHFIRRHPEYNLNHLNIEESLWPKSLFKRIGYAQRQATTGKAEISEKLKAEIETVYLYSIVKKSMKTKFHHL